MDNWYVNVNSWIIQDGNYQDFNKNEIYHFAIEFYSDNLIETAQEEISSTRINASNYKICGKVVFSSNDFVVIDIGVLIYSENKDISKYHVGDYLSGSIWLGIDPYFYFEYGYKIEKIPALIYKWKIDKILIQTAPFIESIDTFGRKYLQRDELKLNHKEVLKTNAWEDDNGNADYILICENSGQDPIKRITNEI
jgi:hypothetical protein